MDTTKLLDILSGKNVFDKYLELKESQWFSESELKDIQLYKFQKLIFHCYANVPYYRKFRCIARNVVAKKWGIYKNGI